VRRGSLGTVVSETRNTCAACGSRKITCERTIPRWLIDLKYYKTGIGVKKWQPRYLIRQYRCRTCGEISLSPDVPFDANSRSLYGHGLICWCVACRRQPIQASTNPLSALDRGAKQRFRGPWDLVRKRLALPDSL
jgi:hypothetical protein